MKKVASPTTTFILAFGVSAALLTGAHLFERVGGLAPCILCLDQREAHWAALTVTVAAYVVGRFINRGPIMLAGLGALTLIYVFSAGLAGYHAGVEWDFWDGPAACAGAGSQIVLDVDAADLFESLKKAGPSGPPCEVAAWRFLGISMAGYNALISIALAAMAAFGCFTALRGQDQKNLTRSIATGSL